MNDAGHVIRHYLTVARRQWWVIAQAAIVVGAVTAFLATRVDDPPFRATTTLLVSDEGSTAKTPQRTDLLLAKRAREVSDPAVLIAAANAVPGETPASIAAAMRTSVNNAAGTITIVGVAADPSRPVVIANAVANAYLDDQREKTNTELRLALTEAEGRAATLEQSLRQVGPAPVGASSSPQRDALIVQLTESYKSIETIKNMIAAADSGVEVVFPATGAARGEKPSPVTRGLAGVAAGLIIGIGLAALREALDTKLRDRVAVEAELPWPVLTELVLVHDKSVGVLAAHERPTGAVAEAMRRLRTNLRFVGNGEPIRSLVVTSPQAGDGKTFVAANLAIAYAQMGVRTLVVSGDLRRPTLDAPFIAKPGPGLCDALTGWVSSDAETVGVMPPGEWAQGSQLESMFRFTGVPNLWLLPSGGTPQNPSELLSSDRAKKLFDRLGQLAEMVIIDAPPLVVVDPLLLGGLADGMLIVASVGDTDRAAARQAREALQSSGKNVVGVILNRMTRSTGTYGYAYEYSSAPAAKPPSRRERKREHKRAKRAQKRERKRTK